MPTEVERRAGRRSDGDARDPGDFVLSHGLVTHEQPALPACAGSNQLNGDVRVDPSGAVQCRRRNSADHRPPPTCQQCADGSITQRRLTSLRHIYPAVNRAVPALQFWSAARLPQHGCRQRHLPSPQVGINPRPTQANLDRRINNSPARSCCIHPLNSSEYRPAKRRSRGKGAGRRRISTTAEPGPASTEGCRVSAAPDRGRRSGRRCFPARPRSAPRCRPARSRLAPQGPSRDVSSSRGG
jgi:hypothetical protein